jgi:hypothetical protein
MPILPMKESTMTTRHSLRDREEILGEHAQLQQMLSSVRETILDRASSRQVVREMLDELAQVLLDHFRHEEAGGYFSAALAIAPRLTERATELVRQHPVLMAQLAALQAHAASRQPTEPWWQQLQLGFAAFFDEFGRHEAGENMLLQDAFHDDLGAED